MVDHWSLQLIIQSLGLSNSSVENQIKDDDDSEEDEKGNGEVRIENTNHDELTEKKNHVLADHLGDVVNLGVH